LILVIGLLSIAAYVWMTRTGRINAGLSDLQVLQKAVSEARSLASAVRSILVHDGDLSLPGSYLVQSVLPARRSDEPVAKMPPSADHSREPSVELRPVLASVGEIMTSGVIVDPLKTVSSQMPFLLGRLLQESGPIARTDGLRVLSLDDVKPASAGWLVRAESRPPAGARADSVAPAAGPSVARVYGARVAEVASVARPQVLGMKTRQVRQGPIEVGDTVVYGQNPVVAIYHTHASEAYQASHGSAYLWGRHEGVVSVGEALAESLWFDYGISVVHSKTFHDVDQFSTAYSKSALTVQGLIALYPQLRLVLDVHRDATGNDSGAVVAVGGVQAARILVLVTTDRYGLPHPNWRLNLTVAQQLQAVLESLYPGLSRGVRQHDDGRFNQHLHPGCLLLEVGDVNNSREEAINSALCLSRAIALALSGEV
jgi:stage II sporulation protein P